MKKIKAIISLTLVCLMLIPMLVSCNKDGAPDGYKLVACDGDKFRLFVPTSWISNTESGITGAYSTVDENANVCTGLIDARGLGIVALAVLLTDEGGGGGLRIGRNAEGVGTHVGDQTLHTAQLRAQINALIQLLGNLHDALGLEIQLTGGLLLHGGGSKGRCGILLSRGALDGIHAEGLSLHGMDDLHGRGLVGQADLALMIAVKTGVEGFSFGMGQSGINGPVLLGHEGTDLVFTIHEDLGGHRLNATGRKTAAHRLPQEGRELVAHDAVEDAAGLLGVHQMHIDGARLLDGGLDHRLGDLVEGNALYLLYGDAESGGQVPGNGLALAIGVGCEEHLVRVLGFLLDLLDDIALSADIDIVGGEIVFNIHAQGALGQITNVTHRSNDLVVRTEIALDGARLGGRLHNDQIRLCHGIYIPFELFSCVKPAGQGDRQAVDLQNGHGGHDLSHRKALAGHVIDGNGMIQGEHLKDAPLGIGQIFQNTLGGVAVGGDRNGRSRLGLIALLWGNGAGLWGH